MILAPLALDCDDSLFAYKLLGSMDSGIQLPDVVVVVSGATEEFVLRGFEDEV